MNSTSFIIQLIDSMFLFIGWVGWMLLFLLMACLV